MKKNVYIVKMDDVRIALATNESFLSFLVDRMDVDEDGVAFPHQYVFGVRRFSLRSRHDDRTLQWDEAARLYEIPLFLNRQLGIRFHDFIPALPFLNAMNSDDLVRALFDWVIFLDYPQENRRRIRQWEQVDVDLSQNKKRQPRRSRKKTKRKRF